MKNNLTLLLILTLGIAIYGQSFPDSEIDGKFYTINGTKIWTVSFGEGEPLFLIAGGPGNAHYYLRAFDSLSTTNTLIFFDGFGRGKSDTASNVNEYPLKRDIDDLEELRKAMDYSSINILGHSYGGVVAQGYSIKYPNNVKRLILANSFHSYLMRQENCDNSNHEIQTNYPELWQKLMKVREEGAVSSDNVHRDLYRVPYGFLYSYNPENFRKRKKSTYPNRMNYELYYQMVGRDGDFLVTSDIGNFDFRKQLKELSMPILIIGGRYDRVAVPWMMVKYKEYCPQSEFVMFEYSGHQPQIEQPEETIALIRDFLSK